MFELFLATIKLRPYVFIFLFFYLIAAIQLMGWQRTLLFTMICWAVAFLSEYSSTRNGFPYGLYHYIETTRGQELWISNVPFMDSLSYTFLQFSAFSVALHGLYLLHKWPDDSIGRLKLAALSAFFVMLLDMIIDPVANQGEKWFLGKIYYYPNGGIHFGVPMSNYLGWYLVGFVSIISFLFLEKFCTPLSNRIHRHLCDWWGVGLYLGVAIFNLGVTWYIKDYPLLLSGFITLGIGSLCWWWLRSKL